MKAEASSINRRSFVQKAGAAALALAVLPTDAAPAPPSPARRRSLRVAHLTDIHVSDKPGAPEGMAAALRHAQGLADQPDILLFGGDCIGDALYTPMEHVLPQWDLWDRVLKAEVKLPAYQCLGNHDIFGWKHRDRASAEKDPAYGKPLALERLGLKTGYYSFDRAGWHFVVLDSMQFAENNWGFVGLLDEPQFKWLEQDLAATPAATPICVLSHLPIFSAAAFFDGKLDPDRNWSVPGASMHIDAQRLKDLFYRHPHVKVCLSGHLHLVDDVTYLGVRYLCNGAVCGGWWKGQNQEFGPLYAVLDFYADGSVERQMVDYGQPRPQEAKPAK
jgi:3',5'-cyclic AMP phosphodiesterase CpdA